MKRFWNVMLIFILVIATLTIEMPVNAAGNTYYVDAQLGDDSNDGVSTSTPWQTLSKVNATTFSPGDTILFKANNSWTGMLHPLGSGDATEQITIDMYGSGNKPLIAGNGSLAGILLDGQAYWTIQNMEVTNFASERAIRHGIAVIAKETGITNNIQILNNDVHDVTGENRRGLAVYTSMYWNGGIFISYPGRSTSANRFNNVLIEGNTVHDVLTSGIRITEHEDFVIDPYYTNVIVRNNVVSRTGSDGILVANCDAPMIENNLVYDAGYNGNTADTSLIAGVWVCSTKNAIIQNNEVARTRLFDSDGTAFDTDWGTGGTTIFQYNYTHGNEGGFWLDCAGINMDSSHIKTICRYNISVDDEGYITRNGNMPCELYNNVFYKSNGTLDANSFASGSQHVYRNNIFNFQTSPDWSLGTYESNLYYPCSANPDDKAAVTADPMFLNPGVVGDGMSYASNYVTASNSPCVDEGVYIADNGNRDFLGNNLYDVLPDIGATEVGASIVVEDTFTFAKGYSNIQGNNGWNYLESDGSTYTNMTWNISDNRWHGSSQYNLVWDSSRLHPDGVDAVIAWDAVKDGSVSISGNPLKGNSGGDGVNVKIMLNSTQVWPSSGWQYIDGADITGVIHDFSIDVTSGDRIYFIVNQYGDTSSDETYWNPTVTYQTRISSYNFPDNYVRHYNYVPRIDVDVLPIEDSQWKVVKGLADSNAISIESVNFPGYYIRHDNYSMVVDVYDGTSGFNEDATFKKVPGLADNSYVSYESYNEPNYYIRHYNYVLILSQIDTNVEKEDATFFEHN